MKVRFALFVLDSEAGRLLGPDGEVRLRPQAFRLLETLIEEAPKILSQEELLDRVWGVEHISPTSVKQAVSEIRQALGDDPARPSIIETVHRRGYRFIAPLQEIAPEPAAPAPAPARLPDLSTRPIPLQAEEEERREETAPLPHFAERNLPPRLGVVLAGLALAAVAAAAIVPRVLPDRTQPPARMAAKADATTAKAPAVSPVRPAVAILGFKNLSGDPADEWISGALVEILGFELAAPGGARLLPAEEVARMKRELALGRAESHSRESLRRIGRNLGTALVVAGSYLEDGGRLRLQVVVQDVATGETVAWARETGSRESLADLAVAVARGVQSGLGNFDGSRAGSRSREAAVFAASAASTESLRLASQALDRLRDGDAPEALRLLEQTAEIDPDNPFVQDALAATLFQLGFEARAREAAGRAQALAAGLPREVRLGIEARAREIHGEWQEAAAIHAALWQRHPDDLEAGLRLAFAQRNAGRTEAALATLARLRQLPPPFGDDPRLDQAESDAAWQLGDFARARDAASRAIAGAEHRGATLLAATGRASRAWAVARLGDSEGALADFEAARAARERLGDGSAAAAAQLGAASVLQGLGRSAEARRIYEDTLPVLAEIGDRRREAKALNNYAVLLHQIDDLDGMFRSLERSLALKRETGDLQGATTTLVNIGNLLRARGDLERAHLRIGEALEISRNLEDAHGTALALRGLANVLLKQSRWAEARSALEEALALCGKSGDADGAAETQYALGDLEKAAGRTERARSHYQQALALWEKLGNEPDAEVTRQALAELQGDLAKSKAS